MDEESEVSQADEIAALLSEAAEVHALVFRVTDDEDADWASWYAKWLIELSEFTDVVSEEMPPSHLIYELVRLEREYEEDESDEPWEMYYAERLIEAFTGEESDEDEEDLDDEEDDDEIIDAEVVDDEDDNTSSFFQSYTQ